jgi:methyl-accepting chemotaxis protein
MEADSYLQILITILIVSVGSGVVIWLLIGLPVRKLTRAAKQLSAGRLDVQVDSGDMIDDLAVLATSFNTMVYRIRDLVADLEQRVKERTAELSAANEQLERQNIRFQETNQELAREVDERVRAERQVQRQLEYVRALSACSQTLLATSGDEADNRRLLVEALQPLVEPARVSKIFLYENFNDLERGFCSRFIMDACAPGIPTA